MRYPTLYMYLVKLPDGMASYPEVQTLADLPIMVRQRWPDLIKRDDLPADVIAAISVPWKEGEWIADVNFMVLNALVRDVIYRNDEGYLQFCYDTMKASFSSTLMRAVMHFVSPSLLLMSAAKRWSMLKRGSTFRTIKIEKSRLYASLTYPPDMYHRCMLQGFGKSFEAAINCTKAKNATVEVEFVSHTECRYMMTWTFD